MNATFQQKGNTTSLETLKQPSPCANMYSVQGVFTLEPVYLVTNREYSCAIII